MTIKFEETREAKWWEYLIDRLIEEYREKTEKEVLQDSREIMRFIKTKGHIWKPDELCSRVLPTVAIWKRGLESRYYWTGWGNYGP